MTIGSELDERSNPSDGSGQSNRDSSRKSSCDPEANSTQSSRDETIREDEDRGINPEISNTGRVLRSETSQFTIGREEEESDYSRGSNAGRSEDPDGTSKDSAKSDITAIEDVNALNQMKLDSDNHVASVKKRQDGKLSSMPEVASVSKDEGYSYKEKLQQKLSSVPGVTSVSKEEGNSYGKKLQGNLSSVPGVSSVSNQENNTEDTFENRLYCKMMSSVAEPASTYKKEAKVDQDSSAHKEKSTQSSRDETIREDEERPGIETVAETTSSIPPSKDINFLQHQVHDEASKRDKHGVECIEDSSSPIPPSQDANLLQYQDSYVDNKFKGLILPDDVCQDDEEPCVHSSDVSGPTRISDAGAPIPISQSHHATEADHKETKLDKPALVLFKECDHPVPPQFIQADDAVFKKQTSSLSFDTPAIIDDDASPLPPSANIYACEALLHEDEDVTVDPEQPQMRIEEDNSAHFNLQEDQSNRTSTREALPPLHEDVTEDPEQPQMQMEHQSTTDNDIFVPEAFLVTDEMISADDIPSAEIVQIEKCSVTIAGRKIHIALLGLVALILISITAALTKTSTSTTSGVALNASEIATQVDVKAITNDLEMHVLTGNKSFYEYPDFDTRNLALNWILDEDPMILSASDSNLRQRYVLALLGLEFELSRPGWLSGRSECFWKGVSCHNGKVNKITFDEYLIGTLPPEIGSLHSLTSLELNWNSLTGSLPTEIGSLRSLTSLDLKDNSLTGTLPTEIGSLRSLTLLDLSQNSLTGSLPTEVGSLQNLDYLDLSWNSLTGSLPTEVGSLFNLIFLHLSWNYYLTGSLPTEIGSLHNLEYLDLDQNSLTGSLPTEIGSLHNLAVLHLSMNSLTGSLPTEIGSLRNLTSLDLSGNYLKRQLADGNWQFTQPSLTGSLPTEIGSLHNLAVLHLSINSLTGSLPTEIGNLRSLTDISLYNNSLTGSLPTEIGSLGSLLYLYLNKNSLTGSLPTEIGSLRNLAHLSLYENSLTGSLPTEIGSLHSLTDLSLYENLLTGSLPTEIGDLILANLRTLDIRSNKFTGVFPESISNAIQISDSDDDWYDASFCFSGNNFTANVPEDFGDCDY